MNDGSLVSKYEAEVEALVDNLIAEYRRKHPLSINGDKNSKRYLNNNLSLEFTLQGMAVNMIEEFAGPTIDKGRIWDALKSINRKYLTVFRDSLDRKSKLFMKT